jgi:(p)ppGpp synthase/HD superfamily hydrolase
MKHDTENQIELAKAIASMAHQGQFRKGGEEPYIIHPARVAKRVLEEFGNNFADAEFFVAVAWLHDSIEDSGGKVTSDWLLYIGVDQSIVDGVVAITKVDGEDYEKYLARVKANKYARTVKIQDMLDNLSDSPSQRQIVKYAKGLQFLLS